MVVNLIASLHSRSNSSPGAPHPLFCQFNELLLSLRQQSFEGASTSQPLIFQKLTILVSLHGCVDNVLHLPYVRQSLVKEHDKKSVETFLDGLVRLIDACGIIMDVLLQNREAVHQLQSGLRRRTSDLDIAKKVALYLNVRRMIKKIYIKFWLTTRTFREMFSLKLSNKQETSLVVNILQESQSISRDVLNSVFSYVAGIGAVSKTDKLFSVSNLVHRKLMPCEEEQLSLRNKFEVVDGSLHTLISQTTKKPINNVQIEKLRCHLEEVDSLAVDLENSIESLCRLLIKSRVTLLNILNH